MSNESAWSKAGKGAFIIALIVSIPGSVAGIVFGLASVFF